MLVAMDAVLHRIEALPGEGRYAVTFRRPDGSEQTAAMHVTDGEVEVAEASLPTGWRRSSDQFRATAGAVLAVEVARRSGPAAATLRDLEGGWDVSLGNVVIGASGAPECTAHGEMVGTGGIYACPECGAQAVLATG
jgi:hypothetical protein